MKKAKIKPTRGKFWHLLFNYKDEQDEIRIDIKGNLLGIAFGLKMGGAIAQHKLTRKIEEMRGKDDDLIKDLQVLVGIVSGSTAELEPYKGKYLTTSEIGFVGGLEMSITWND